MSVTDIVMIVTHIVTEVIFIVVQVQKVQKVHMFSLKSRCKYRAPDFVTHFLLKT